MGLCAPLDFGARRQIKYFHALEEHMEVSQVLQYLLVQVHVAQDLCALKHLRLIAKNHVQQGIFV